MDQKQAKSFTKTTKVSLVVYCSIMTLCLIAFLIVSGVTKNYSFLYAYCLCLGPSIFFAFISLIFPITRLTEAKVGKSVIVWYIIGYVLKYAAIIGIPFIGLANPDNFDKWVMLATTLIAPVTVIISKLIIANIVSKSVKNQSK